MLSLDLDGTLLSPLLKRAKKADCLAIQEYMNAGGMPFINTGRALESFKADINDMFIDNDKKDAQKQNLSVYFLFYCSHILCCRN